MSPDAGTVDAGPSRTRALIVWTLSAVVVQTRYRWPVLSIPAAGLEVAMGKLLGAEAIQVRP